MNSEQRRQFLRNAALTASVAALPRWAWSTPPALQTNPFALGIASGDPVLRIERLTHDIHGTPVDFEFLYFRGDTFQYRFRVDRHRPQE